MRSCNPINISGDRYVAPAVLDDQVEARRELLAELADLGGERRAERRAHGLDLDADAMDRLAVVAGIDLGLRRK